MEMILVTLGRINISTLSNTIWEMIAPNIKKIWKYKYSSIIWHTNTA